MTSLHELGTSSVPANTHTVFTMKSNSYKTPAKRLERCRINQQRYRERKQAIRSTIIQIEREIDSLERDIRLRRESRSPCRVVADTLKLLLVDLKSQTDHVAERQLVEALGNSFALDVAMGDVSGVDALINQLQRYEQYFDDPRIRLEQIEEPALGVVTAAGTLGITVSVYTLFSVFPQLLNASRNEHDTEPLLGKRLVGKRLHCDCSIRFIFDEKSGRVTRLEASVNWIGALHGALGNLEDVSNVLDGALINC
ncbi:hypothetical protein JG688_00006713 [Phytophthora aleatoria]|uniref:Bzip transcription factor n=1 Tax=Phytophthora aleatoria TaxID=2496075 RepID=A0A8J5MGM5_9STRA|nr:hypothetical protein JG688_00006713 [Phytophthora aleatoria]